MRGRARGGAEAPTGAVPHDRRQGRRDLKGGFRQHAKPLALAVLAPANTTVE